MADTSMKDVLGMSFPTLSGIDIGLQRRILFVGVTRCRNHAFRASPRGLGLLERISTSTEESWRLGILVERTIDGSVSPSGRVLHLRYDVSAV